MDASPGGSILKRASSEKALIAVQEIEPVVEPANNGKIRRVHFPENPVSDQVLLQILLWLVLLFGLTLKLKSSKLLIKASVTR